MVYLSLSLVEELTYWSFRIKYKLLHITLLHITASICLSVKLSTIYLY